MKQTAAVLSILVLLLLSGCRIENNPGATDTPVPSPVPSATLRPTETVQPQSTPTPEPTASQPGTLTAQKLTDLAQEWCETYADRFAGYEAIRMSRAYWFADYSGTAAQIPFTTADGLDGTVSFFPDPDGILSPVGVAAQLLGQPVESLILVDRSRMVEEMGRRLSALVDEGLTEVTALDAFLRNAEYTPALTEDTWYCVNVDDTGYLLMAHQGGYRLQRMAAMVEYSVRPEFQIRSAWDRAAQSYGWLTIAPLPRSEEDMMPHPEGGEETLYRVNYPGISSMLELRTHLKTLFSDEIVDGLFAYNLYTELDGVLYQSDRVLGLAQRIPSPTSTQVIRESDTRLVYRVNSETDSANYVYELVGDRWMFTEFPYLAP